MGLVRKWGRSGLVGGGGWYGQQGFIVIKRNCRRTVVSD